MSGAAHSSHTATKQGHGTTKSYVTGFILSLIFTVIPYYLVVNKTFSGSALQAAILGFAVLQMLIQITFFLHLGRGPKPNFNLFFFASTVGIILVIVGGSIMIINNLHYNMPPTDQTKKLVNDEAISQIGGVKTGACEKIGANHKVVIKNSQVSPFHTDANKCDTMTFINEDNEEREISFGPHPKHEAYAGNLEMAVVKGRGKTITLSESGTYLFHDHLHAEIFGEFTVSP